MSSEHLHIELENIHVHIPEERTGMQRLLLRGPEYGQHVLRGVDLEIEAVPGTYTAIEGPSGSGKTTLLTTILGGLPGNQDRPTEGRVLWDGFDIYDMKPVERSEALRRVGFIPQTFLPMRGLTIAERVTLPYRLESRYERRAANKTTNKKVADVLDEVGLEKLPTSSNANLSNGEMRRMAFASALLGSEVEMLLADEPTAGLNGSSKDGINNLMSRLNDEGMPMVFITHEQHQAKTTVDIQDGRVVGRHDTPVRGKYSDSAEDSGVAS
ncbi:MAG: ATP-binding cassette domain-containing protein [Candidatus Saccharibacteria bacterium]|nr:ATP-binding cassette domain-containing protein [Candidatus Saccharibacteria bacterium]